MRATKREVSGYQWFVLRVKTGREDMVERALMHRGFATFCPHVSQWRFANGIARRRGIKKRKMFPVFSGYCFVGLSEVTPSWGAIWPVTPVLTVIGREGVPTIVAPEPFRWLLTRHGRGEFNAPEHHRWIDTHREFNIGDAVITGDGLIEGRVEAIDGRKATIFVRLLGADRKIEADVDQLVAA